MSTTKYVKKLPSLDGYTYEMVKKVVESCKDRTEFYTKHSRLRRYAEKMGWMGRLVKVIPHKRKWTLETLKKEALKYKTRSEFMKKNISAYNSALKSDHYNEIVSHMGERKKFAAQVKWNYNDVKSKYLKCKTLSELKRKYGQNMMASAVRNGWHDEFSKHFKKELHKNTKWTFETVKQEAKKYNSRKEFGRNSPSAYQKALEMEWMDKICNHMVNGYVKWTKEKIMEIMGDSKTMSDIRKKSNSLYVFIKRNKLEKTIFK